MRPPPFECLFCRSRSGPFTRIEHPIPESLGNDDEFLGPGFVCDPCNQYFGAKVEAGVLSSPPWNWERAAFAIKTKKGKPARAEHDLFSLESTGSNDVTYLSGPDEIIEPIVAEPGGLVFPPQPSAADDDLTVRFLLKVGLGLLAVGGNVDPYAERFNAARKCSRYGDGASTWNFGYGLYPDRDDLLVSTRRDELGELETHQIYQFDLGVMADGDVILCFAFTQHVYACNLSRPNLDTYLSSFNLGNTFRLEGRQRKLKGSPRGQPLIIPASARRRPRYKPDAD